MFIESSGKIDKQNRKKKMAKKYLKKDVLQASLERLEIILTEFDNVYFSVSGGKDSSVMVQLANIVAQKNTYSTCYLTIVFFLIPLCKFYYEVFKFFPFFEPFKKLNKKFDILFIDLEAQYQYTVEHIEDFF